MQSLVKAGLLQEAAQVLLLMPQKGLWPDALLMADVLSFVDAPAANAANSSLNSLLQARPRPRRWQYQQAGQTHKGSSGQLRSLVLV